MSTATKSRTKLHSLFGAAIAGLASALIKKESSSKPRKVAKWTSPFEMNSYYAALRKAKLADSFSYPHSSAKQAAAGKRHLASGMIQVSPADLYK